MTTDLDDALRSAAADLHLDRPLGDVLARGAVIRRRRRGLRAGLAAGVLAGACAVTAAAMRPADDDGPPVALDDTPTATPTAGPADQPMVNLSPADLAAADQDCRTLTSEMDLPERLAPTVADSRDGTAILLYRFEGRFILCTSNRGEDGRVTGGGSTAGVWEPLPAGRTFALDGFTFAGPEQQGPPRGGPVDPEGVISDVSGTFRVAGDVARLVLHIGVQDVEARIAGELAMLWLPDGLAAGDIQEARVTTYAADGSVLEDGPAQRDRPGPRPPEVTATISP